MCAWIASLLLRKGSAGHTCNDGFCRYVNDVAGGSATCACRPGHDNRQQQSQTQRGQEGSGVGSRQRSRHVVSKGSSCAVLSVAVYQ
jgi:hypothetical protein